VDDSVGDVLHVRRKLAGSEITGVFGSLLLHLLLFSAAVLAANRHPQPMALPFIAIKFAPLPAAVAPRLPAAQAIVTSRPPQQSIEQPKIEQPIVETVKPLPKSVSTKTVPLSAFGKSTKRGEEKQGLPPAAAPPPPTAAPAPATSSAAAVPAVGSAGVSGLEGGDFPYTIYIERMRTLVAGKWFRPQASDALTSVYFIIDRDGAIRDARIESPSGNGTFDRAALRAVLEASPLPPLPFGYTGSYLGVHLTFH
jgi:TonB family protein